jgi:hypothetical protein
MTCRSARRSSKTSEGCLRATGVWFAAQQQHRAALGVALQRMTGSGAPHRRPAGVLDRVQGPLRATCRHWGTVSQRSSSTWTITEWCGTPHLQEWQAVFKGFLRVPSLPLAAPGVAAQRQHSH